MAEVRVLALHARQDGQSTLFRLKQGMTLQFRPGPSLIGCEIKVWINLPSADGVFRRETYRQLEWKNESNNPNDDTANFIDLELDVSGSFRFYFTCKSDEDVDGSGFIIVDPALLVGPQREDRIELDSIQMQSVLSKNLGDISTWEDKLRVGKESGYNVIHFTPVQALGGSNSAYSLADQHQLNSTFNAKWSDIDAIVKKMRGEWNMASICDIVLNHTANETEWIRSQPDATFNVANSPHLRPAYLFDRIFHKVSVDIEDGAWVEKGIPKGEVTTQGHLETIRSVIYDVYLPEVKIYEFYMMDTAIVIEQFEKKILASNPPQSTEPRGNPEDLKIIQDPDYRRLKSTVDLDLAESVFNVQHHDCHKEEDRILKCCSELKKLLDRLNHEAYNTCWNHVNSGVKNVMLGATYHRLADDGPHDVKCGRKNPLVCQYFTGHDDCSLAEAEKLMFSEKGAGFMAHNGWVMDHDPLINFALPGSNVYLRRELIAWGDSVKLRFGDKPEDSPFLWQYMKEYAEQTARVFDGIRLDNCHSTPLNVAEYMLDAARAVRPNLYVIAELFTSSEGKDNIFINRLGINSMIREALQAWDSHEEGRLVHRFGGEPVGAFIQPRNRPLVPSMAHAVFFDQTHDNPSPCEKRSIYDLIPSSALVNMACCATGSNRGYDELVPHHIHVVSEPRTYNKWSDLESRANNIINVKKALNHLHFELGNNGFTEVYVDQMDVDVVAVTRHCPATHESVVLVAHTAFSKGSNPDHIRFVKPVSVEGSLIEVVLEANLKRVGAKPFVKDNEVINGVADHEAYLKRNFDLKESKMARLSPCSNESSTTIDLCNFPPGSAIAFRFKLFPRQDAAATAVQGHLSRILSENSEVKAVIDKMNLLDLNYALFRCNQEESECDGCGAYSFDGYGQIKYAGIQGIMSILSDIRPGNDLGNWLPGNLRNGNWLMDYVVGRLEKKGGTRELSQWLRNVFAQIGQVPRYLIPRYFDAIITNTYLLLLLRSWKLMSPFVQNGSNLVKALALGSVIHTAVVWNAPLPELSPNLAEPRPGRDEKNLALAPTIAAGLPHFSTGYMRSWGRDTFIALRGFLNLTGRYQDARCIILGYAATLRHGLIPNLLDGGKNARFNCRDAIWWWLYNVVCYVEDAPQGAAILKDKVSRLFPTDDSPACPPGQVEQPLEDVILEALQTHFQGLKFRERNAGTKIDEHMKDEGFNNEIGVDLETGFVFGGNVNNCGTWMDKMGSSAKAGNKGTPASPRDGSAVEIVGLSYASLKALAELNAKGLFSHAEVIKTASDGSKTSWSLKNWSEKIRANFEKNFYISKENQNEKRPDLINKEGIYKDTLNAGQPWTDYQLRCNFPITMAVAPDLFNPEHAWNALQVVKVKLLGPLGLKTLDPDDWAYRGNYDNGNQGEDPSVAHGFNYHQGPEWVWPIGYFLRAWLAFGERVGLGLEARAFVMACLSNHFVEVQQSHWRGIPELTNENGSICPGSNPIQAWSMSTLLEVLLDLEKK